MDPKFLNLTKVDDLIYQEFRETFRELRVDLLDPEELKSEPAKAVGEGFYILFLSFDLSQTSWLVPAPRSRRLKLRRGFFNSLSEVYPPYLLPNSRDVRALLGKVGKWPLPAPPKDF